MKALADKGISRRKIAAQFGVGISTVYIACGRQRSRCGVKPGFTNYDLMYDILNTELPYAVLARKYDITRQRVAQIAIRLTITGFKFPPRPRGGVLGIYRSQ